MSREPFPQSIESCAYQFLTWRPFLETTTTLGPQTKRPCRSDRATSSFSIDATILDMSKLSLFDTPKPISSAAHRRFFARKRRRRAGAGASRSVSGRSSDRRCCASAANGTCSDFPMAAGGTDSSGEMFGDGNWGSDVERVENVGNSGNSNSCCVGGGNQGQFGNCGEGNMGNESGYGSEPGYRGDAELGYDDEEEDEEGNQRGLFWGDEGDDASKLEGVGENSLQKAHHRGRRKKHDLKMVDNI